MAMKEVVLVLALVAITFPNIHFSRASELESFSTDPLAHHADLVHHSEALLHSLASTSPHLHHQDVHHHDLAHDLHHDIHHDLHDHTITHHDHTITHHDHVVVGTPTGTARSGGFWKKRFLWKPRWVKTWQEKKIYVGVWKRVWGPVQVTEWVPIPKPPPGWSNHH